MIGISIYLYNVNYIIRYVIAIYVLLRKVEIAVRSLPTIGLEGRSLLSDYLETCNCNLFLSDILQWINSSKGFSAQSRGGRGLINERRGESSSKLEASKVVMTCIQSVLHLLSVLISWFDSGDS